MCEATAGNNINLINLTAKIPGVLEDFINHWDESIGDMRDIRQPLNVLIGVKILKEKIPNIFYIPITNRLDILKSYATNVIDIIDTPDTIKQ